MWFDVPRSSVLGSLAAFTHQPDNQCAAQRGCTEPSLSPSCLRICNFDGFYVAIGRDDWLVQVSGAAFANAQKRPEEGGNASIACTLFGRFFTRHALLMLQEQLSSYIKVKNIYNLRVLGLETSWVHDAAAYRGGDARCIRKASQVHWKKYQITHR